MLSQLGLSGQAKPETSVFFVHLSRDWCNSREEGHCLWESRAVRGKGTLMGHLVSDCRPARSALFQRGHLGYRPSGNTLTSGFYRGKGTGAGSSQTCRHIYILTTLTEQPVSSYASTSLGNLYRPRRDVEKTLTN